MTSTIRSKFRATNSPFKKAQMNTKVGVMIYATKILFDIKEAHLTQSDLFVYVSDEDAKFSTRENSIDVAHRVTTKLKDGYSLFIDDERIPGVGSSSRVGTCVVARTVKAAKDVIEKLGPPRFLHLDYQLRYPENTESFVNWFIERYSNPENKLPDDFCYNVHSQHPTGRIVIDKKMFDFYYAQETTT